MKPADRYLSAVLVSVCCFAFAPMCGAASPPVSEQVAKTTAPTRPTRFVHLVRSEKGQPVATNTTLLGREHCTITSPFNAVVIGMTTLPATSPGEPICNLGKLPKATQPSEFRRLRSDKDGLEERVVEELASNVLVTEPTDDPKAQKR